MQNRSIITLYLTDVREAAKALPKDSEAKLHFDYLVRVMEREELEAVFVYQQIQ